MSSNRPDKSSPTSAKKDDQPTTTTSTTPNRNNDQQPSLLSRIQNSASALIQDTLTNPSGANLSGDLAHVLDSVNKASSSSASFSAGTFSGQTRRTDGFGGGNSSAGGSQDGGYTTGINEGFRSSQPNSNDVSEIDSFENSGGFFSTSDNHFTQREEETEEVEKGKGKGKSREHAPYSNHSFDHDQNIDIEDEYESSHFNAYEIAWINAARSGTVYRSTSTASTPSKRLSQSQSDLDDSTAQFQAQYENEHDGAEVVMMLSDPSFQPGLATWDDEENEHYGGTHDGLGFGLDLDDNDPLDSEGFPHALVRDLSPAEMQILDSFRKQQPEQHQQKKKITALSLVPDIESFLSEHNTSTISTNDDALRNEVISNLIGAEEWLNVDERYGEEVWGYLRPVVEAAAAEIKEKELHKDGDGDGDGPAVKRLKMILRHMARL